MYKNGTMRPIEPVLRRGKEGIKEKDRRVTLTKIL
jgi:hypothetical protein